MKEHVAEIVAAYVRNNDVSSSTLPGLIASVSQSLASLGQTVDLPKSRTPAVPIRRSVGNEEVTCLDCGKQAKMLKRHLGAAHGLNVDEYRARWGLPSDFPLTARNYAARRSEIAKAIGLGRPATRQTGRAKSP